MLVLSDRVMSGFSLRLYMGTKAQDITPSTACGREAHKEENRCQREDVKVIISS